MEIFKKLNQPLKGGVLLSELLKIRPYKCECCGLSEWNKLPITLQAHHIDGDRTNNVLDNLSLLCPNCHSQTDNFGSKNIKKEPVSDEKLIEALKAQPSIRQALLSVGLSDGSVNYKRARALLSSGGIVLPEKDYVDKNPLGLCIDCGRPVSYNAMRCNSCASVKRNEEVSQRPSREILKEQIRTLPFVKIGTLYGVTDNAVRKWCDFYELPRKKSEIKKISDEEWLTI